MLQTITLPRAPESNAIGAWTHQLPEPFPSPDVTAYWLIAGAMVSVAPRMATTYRSRSRGVAGVTGASP